MSGTEFNERAILSLPPKFAIMGKISHKEVKVETRKAAVKLRWEERGREGDENEVRADVRREEEIQREPFQLNRGVVNYSYKRATDMSGNKRVHLPQNHLGMQRESNLLVWENELVATARDLERHGTFGSNLTDSLKEG